MIERITALRISLFLILAATLAAISSSFYMPKWRQILHLRPSAGRPHSVPASAHFLMEVVKENPSVAVEWEKVTGLFGRRISRPSRVEAKKSGLFKVRSFFLHRWMGGLFPKTATAIHNTNYRFKRWLAMFLVFVMVLFLGPTVPTSWAETLPPATTMTTTTIQVAKSVSRSMNGQEAITSLEMPTETQAELGSGPSTGSSEVTASGVPPRRFPWKTGGGVLTVATGSGVIFYWQKKKLSGWENSTSDNFSETSQLSSQLPPARQKTSSSNLPLMSPKYRAARSQPKSAQEESTLAEKYAAIADIGDRAFQILLDLGMIDADDIATGTSS